MTRVTQYLHRIAFRFVASALLPNSVRRIALIALGCKIGTGTIISDGTFFGSNKITIGNDCYLNIGVFLDGSDRVVIHDNVRIGAYAKFLTGTHPIRNSVIRRRVGDDIGAPIIIHRGCWIGMDAIVMPGVEIAEGCVLAAGAVLTTSTTPNGLYAGVPAIRKKDLPVSDDIPAA
jgi:maltose O-acetyltransferase